VLALQRTAGNAAVTRMLARKGPAVHGPSLEQRQAATEHSLEILAKRQAVSEQDARWQARIAARLASWTQAAARMTTAMTGATTGFQGAQSAQTLADAVELQLVGNAITLGFASGFQYMFTRTFGKNGVLSPSAEKWMELIENPANTLMSGALNVAGAEAAKDAASRADAPTGNPLSLLTSATEAIAGYQQRFQAALLKRREELDKLSDKQWEQLALGTQEAIYIKLLTEIELTGDGVERLKPAAELAAVLERHLWALWLKAHPFLLQIGGEIEDRLNAAGVSERAGVVLTGHWYSSNEPDDWRDKLMQWARGYNERLGKA
jgi:hypothetical protein